VSSRALRRYDAIGLLPPSHVAPDGRGHHDDALIRLQQVLSQRSGLRHPIW
jgi:MerR family transcriptional regulator, thiopeptide resistance regulator